MVIRKLRNPSDLRTISSYGRGISKNGRLSGRTIGRHRASLSSPVTPRDANTQPSQRSRVAVFKRLRKNAGDNILFVVRIAIDTGVIQTAVKIAHTVIDRLA